MEASATPIQKCSWYPTMRGSTRRSNFGPLLVFVFTYEIRHAACPASSTENASRFIPPYASMFHAACLSSVAACRAAISQTHKTALEKSDHGTKKRGAPRTKTRRAESWPEIRPWSQISRRDSALARTKNLHLMELDLTPSSPSLGPWICRLSESFWRPQLPGAGTTTARERGEQQAQQRGRDTAVPAAPATAEATTATQTAAAARAARRRPQKIWSRRRLDISRSSSAATPLRRRLPPSPHQRSYLPRNPATSTTTAARVVQEALRPRECCAPLFSRHFWSEKTTTAAATTMMPTPMTAAAAVAVLAGRGRRKGRACGTPMVYLRRRPPLPMGVPRAPT